MTSGNVANIGPNIMVNTKTVSKDDDKSLGFLDVMNKNVAKSNRDLQSQDSSKEVKAPEKKINEKDDSKAVDASKETAKEDKTNKTDKVEDTEKTTKLEKPGKAEQTDKTEATDVKPEDAAMISEEMATVAEATEVLELPPEVMELVNEVLNNFESEVKDVLVQALGITEEELSDVMADMNITFADLLNPKQVTELMVEATNVEDSVSLVLDENLSDALSQIRELSTNVIDKTGLEAPVIQEAVNQSGKGIEIPKEMLNANPNQNLDIDPNLQTANVGEEVDMTKVPKEVLQSNPEMAKPVMTDGKEVKVEDIPDDEKPVVVKNDQTTVSENEESTETEVSDNTFTTKQTTENNSDNSNSFTRHDNRQETGRQFNTDNIVVNNQNVQPEANVTAEAKPVITRFTTMQMITQITEAARINLSDETTSIEMILNPESLGKIYLNVSQKQGALHAQIVAQNEAVKEALENQIALLKENLNKAGVKVEAVEVSVGTHEFERNLEEGMHQQEEQARQQEEQASNMRRKPVSINLNNLDELQGLMSEEDKLVAQMMKDQGNSMNLQA
ncbi:MAG: flagellar hook-length control protein FliK [Lachnospiraceae bacterium]|nr:flagellar hook-length control protein FliK [Lachnospiraceae bacterium]